MRTKRTKIENFKRVFLRIIMLYFTRITMLYFSRNFQLKFKPKNNSFFFKINKNSVETTKLIDEKVKPKEASYTTQQNLRRIKLSKL